MITLRSKEPVELRFQGCEQDTVLHCQDGVVTTSCLLLALLSPSLLHLLDNHREQEKLCHISCPGVAAVNLAAFLRDLHEGDRDIGVPEDIRSLLYPKQSFGDRFVKVEAPLPSPQAGVKEELIDDVEGATDEKCKIDDFQMQSMSENEDGSDDEDEPDEPKPKHKTRKHLTSKPSDGETAEKKWLDRYHKECFCNLEFTNNIQRTDHFKTFHAGYTQCTECLRVLKDVTKKHKCQERAKGNDRRGATCHECGRVFKKSSSMYSHMKAYHSKTTSECEKCGKVFKCEIYMREHLKKVHSENQACTICGKQVAKMQVHVNLVHTDKSEWRYKCEVCGNRFVDKGKLKTHLNIHQNIKPYSCREGCKMSFSDSSNRNQHERRVHGAKKKSSNNILLVSKT